MKKSILKIMFLFMLSIVFMGLSSCENGEATSFFHIEPKLKILNNILSWDKQENADGYLIFCNDENIDSTTDNTYIIKIIGSNVYKIKAYKKVNNELIYSNFSNAVINILSKLDTPILKSDNNKIFWEKINNVIGYEININGKVVFQKENYVSITEPNKYNVSVRAIGDMILYNNSEESVLEFYITLALNTPFLEIDRNIVKWKKIDNAIEYKIFVNDKVVSIVNSSLLVNEFFYEIVNIENVELYVIAYGKNECILSDKSNIVTKTAIQLEKPSLKLENNILKWDSIDNAIEYLIEINGNKELTQKTYINLNYLKEQAQIKVSAKGNPIFYLQSEFCSIEYTFKPYETIETAIVEIKGKFASWTKPQGTESFKIIVNGEEISTTMCEYEFKKNVDESISVIAIGNYYLDSAESEKHYKKMILIDSPTYEIEENRITLNNSNGFTINVVETSCDYNIENNVISVTTKGEIKISINYSGDDVLYLNSKPVDINIDI